MKNYIILIFLLIFNFGYTQKKYPKDYFSSPLKIPIILSGTFGELRTGHFHSGMDIKTQGKEGIPIYAPANGYVSRIKVSQWGFGKALYITHPNGYTTVYAHLKKYAPNLQEYVKKVQYKKKNYTTGNLFPKANKFPIKKGEIIGFTGDTGGSGGPHLHYEIRDTKTEHIINPMHFGLKVKDTRKPVFQKLLAYPVDENSRINNTSKSISISLTNLGEGKYTAKKITANGYIGLGVSVFDRLNGASNKNGIYSLEMKVNGKRHYYHNVETFSFPETKFINLLIDYRYFNKFRRRVQKTFKHPKSTLSMYKDLIDDGKIFIKKDSTYNIEIIAKDFKGNSSIIEIPVTGVASTVIFSKKDTTAYKIIAQNFHKFKQKNVTVAFPKNTFYDNFYLDFKVENGIAKVHEPTIPLNKRYTITFYTDSLSEKQKKKVYIANITKPKYPRFVSARKKKNKIFATTKTLGKYGLEFDYEAPVVKMFNFKDKQWVSKLKTLKVKISDKKSGIKNWKATIDGQWILMEFNHKRGILTYDFSDKKLVGSKHIFKLVVSDNVGNTKTLSATFYRK